MRDTKGSENETDNAGHQASVLRQRLRARACRPPWDVLAGARRTLRAARGFRFWASGRTVARVGPRIADCACCERSGETMSGRPERVSLRRQRKTAISSAVRGTSNRYCGIAAAMGFLFFPIAVRSRGVPAGRLAGTVAKAGQVRRHKQRRPTSGILYVRQFATMAESGLGSRSTNPIWNHWY
jgi:hypothetical protein